MRSRSTSDGRSESGESNRVRAVRGPAAILVVLTFTALPGCSIKRVALNSVANSLSGGGSSVFLTDDDPVLVGEALPFSLKFMESILAETPDHEGLLVATASGFVMYAHGWVLQPARELESIDLVAARRERARAKSLFMRGREYAGRALESRHPGVVASLGTDPAQAAASLNSQDVPAMYWYAAALGSALSSDKNDMELLAELPVATTLLQRALVLDEGWNRGAIHELLMVVLASQPSGAGGGADVAELHFERARELNGGVSVGALVSFAETVCVRRQDQARFEDLLSRALAFDPDRHPDTRLANIIAQEHARWLLTRSDELFIQDLEETDPGLPVHGGLFPWPVER